MVTARHWMISSARSCAKPMGRVLARPSAMPRSVLFVCTGNIFRSMTAEYALRRQLGAAADISIASAGTAHRPTLTVRGDVAAYLQTLGLDVSGHQRRTLDAVILKSHDAVIAMNSDHQRFLQDRFQRPVPVFLEAATGVAQDMPDVDDLFAPEDHLSPPAIEHVRQTINRIIDLTPALAAWLTRD